MKKILLIILSITIVANAMSFSWFESKLNSSGTIPSTWNEVKAAGYDFRSYTWIDTAGRVCTTLFTNDRGGSIDCDFPPKDFDYESFLKKTVK